MSYNNFSYYTGPASSSQWSMPKDPTKRGNKDPWRKTILHTDNNSQSGKQNLSHVYAQSMILPSATRSALPLLPHNDLFQVAASQILNSFGYTDTNSIFPKRDKATAPASMQSYGSKISIPASAPSRLGAPILSRLEKRDSLVPGVRTPEVPRMQYGPTKKTVASYQSNKRPSESKRVRRNSVKDRLSTDSTGSNGGGGGGGGNNIQISNNNNNKVNNNNNNIQLSNNNNNNKVNNNNQINNKSKSSKNKNNKGNNKGGAESGKQKKATEDLKRKADDDAAAEDGVAPTAKAPKWLDYEQPPAAKEAPPPASAPPRQPSPPPEEHYECFSQRELDCSALRRLWPSLPLPEEFFHACLQYQHSFPLNHPLRLGNECRVAVLDKKVQRCEGGAADDRVDPDDADPSFVVKVMLLCTEELGALYKATVAAADGSGGDGDEGGARVEVPEAVRFLVGSVGPCREVGLGGAWSPSLDGPDPGNDPEVLIRTAVRTCRALTGIDLSACSSWHRFMELRYYRPAQSSTGDNEAAEPLMETVVYFLPDVWHCVPSEEAWRATVLAYESRLAGILCPPPPVPPPRVPVAVETEATPVREEQMEETEEAEAEEEDYEGSDSERPAPPATDAALPTLAARVAAIGAMKVADMKQALLQRGLNHRGVMDQLKARLRAALEKEEQEGRLRAETAVLLTADEKAELQRLYRLPATPAVLVHQSRAAYGGLLTVAAVPLRALLSYGDDATLPEATFELALFARHFLSMLRRDAVFDVYKALVVARDEDLRPPPRPAAHAQWRTVNRHLLFSCTLLDPTGSGRLSLGALRAQIEGLGICLSPRQLTAVLARAVACGSPVSLEYRLLTDRDIPDEAIAAGWRSQEAVEDLDYVGELALGNKALFDAVAPPGAADGSSTVNIVVERLRNELDRSEQRRQAVELSAGLERAAAAREVAAARAERAASAALVAQVAESRARCASGQERGDRLQREADLLRQRLLEIDRVAAGLSAMVAETVVRLGAGEGAPSVPSVPREERDATDSPVRTAATQQAAEDFELSKPSDYEYDSVDLLLE